VREERSRSSSCSPQGATKKWIIDPVTLWIEGNTATATKDWPLFISYLAASRRNDDLKFVAMLHSCKSRSAPEESSRVSEDGWLPSKLGRRAPQVSEGASKSWWKDEPTNVGSMIFLARVHLYDRLAMHVPGSALPKLEVQSCGIALQQQ